MNFREYREKTDKGIREDPYLRYVMRPPAVRLAYLVRNINADYITILSIIIVIFGGIVLSLGMPLIGAIIINFYLLIDCVDGTVARFRGPTPFGRYLDSIGADMAYISMFSGAGMVTYILSGEVIFIVLGFITALSKIMERYLRDKYVRIVVMGKPTEETKKEGGTKAESNNIGFLYRSLFSVGLYPIILLVAIIHSLFDFVLIWKIFVVVYALAMPLIAYISIAHLIKLKKNTKK